MGIIEKTFRNGEIIINEGDIGRSFFQLLEGSALVYAGFGKNDQIKLATIKEGEYFGEMSILEEYPRSATIVASGNVKVLEIPRDELRAYFSEDTDRIIKLMIYLGNRVDAMIKDQNEASGLLNQLKEADASKKKSLFSMIKKHVDMYQSNKNMIIEPSAEALRDAKEVFSDEGSGELVSYSKGAPIFSEGDDAPCMYVLYAGKVGIYQNYGKADQVKTADLESVAFFGEMGLLTEAPRSSTAIAETDNTCVEIIYLEDLESIYRTCPVKIDLILRHLSYRLRKVNNDFLITCKEITELYNKR